MASKASLITQSYKLGYTIKYHENENEIRLRKAGSHVNAMNQPYEYYSIYKKGRSWIGEEKLTPQII
jgi:hypothetical protein